MEIDGLSSLLVKLDKLTDISVITSGVQESCQKIQNEAQHNCNVDTGILKDSIQHSVESANTFVSGTVGTNCAYAPYKEFGTGLFASQGNGRKTPWSYCDASGNWHTTVGQHPQPFLLPAMTDNIGSIREILKYHILQKIREIEK